MKGATLGIVLSTWAYVVFILMPQVRHEGLETRRVAIELVHAQAVARSRGPLHTYAVNFDDDTLCVTNVVDDGEIVWPCKKGVVK